MCKEEIKAIVGMLENNCLVTTDREVGGAGSKWYGLGVHDLVLDVGEGWRESRRRYSRGMVECWRVMERSLRIRRITIFNRHDATMKSLNVTWRKTSYGLLFVRIGQMRRCNWALTIVGFRRSTIIECQEPFKLVICNLKKLSDHNIKHNDATLRTVASEV